MLTKWTILRVFSKNVLFSIIFFPCYRLAEEREAMWLLWLKTNEWWDTTKERNQTELRKKRILNVLQSLIKNHNLFIRNRFSSLTFIFTTEIYITFVHTFHYYYCFCLFYSFVVVLIFADIKWLLSLRIENKSYTHQVVCKFIFFFCYLKCERKISHEMRKEAIDSTKQQQQQ